jgi:putative acetyltransferase
MEIELREAPPGDPVTIRLAEAMRAEVEERGAHNGAPRPNMSMAEAIEADSARVVAYAGPDPVGIAALRPVGKGIAEIKRMYVIPEYRGSGVAWRILEELERLAAGFRRIEAYNSNPRADRWYEKPLA